MRLKRWLAREVQSEYRRADLRTNPGRELPESLTRRLPAIDGVEAELLSLGIIIVVALGCWLEYYALAFWVLCYAVGNGALAGMWAALTRVGTRTDAPKRASIFSPFSLERIRVL